MSASARRLVAADAGCFSALYFHFVRCRRGARPVQLFFETWQTENGLPQNHGTAIVQTPDGYLWFSTYNGLVRFDGVRFTIFNTANSPGLASSRITSLHADSDGIL